MAKIFLSLSLCMLTLLSCVHRTPAPKASTEFLLAASGSQASKAGSPEEGMDKKKAVYRALKDLRSKNNVVIIYDASGSMRDKTGNGPRKFEVAYEGLKQIGTLFQSSDQVRLIVFGSKKRSGITNEGIIPRKDYIRAIEASSDVEVVYGSPEKGFDQKDFLAAIKFLGSESTYIGDTPIGYAVLKADQILKDTQNSNIILITDGLETGPLLARDISKDKALEERLRKKYPSYDQITMSASEAIKKLMENRIHFSPILYGLSPKNDQSVRGKESQKIRSVYQQLATQSGSIYLEAATSGELLNAFMDADIMSLAYALYPLEGKKDQPAARGKVGLSIMVEEGRYLLKMETEHPLEQAVELKPQMKNVYYFDIGKDGKPRIYREGEKGS